MGCQCAKKSDEDSDELKKESLDGINEEQKDDFNNNINNKNDVFGLNNQDINNNEEQRGNHSKSKREKRDNEGDEEYIERINEEKNAKYAEYPDKMLEIINRIRENPASYADYIEESIKNIIEEQDKNDENKTKIIYKKKVKVALTTGESAFRDAAEILRNMEPLPPLEFNGNICIPLPETVEEIKDHAFLKEQVKILRETTNIDIFFKDLIKVPEVSALLMIVDDNIKNSGRKRQAILNKDFKYIGINSHFIGKTFVAYFAFSK